MEIWSSQRVVGIRYTALASGLRLGTWSLRRSEERKQETYEDLRFVHFLQMESVIFRY
jgi:hypothetical protein